MSYKKVAIQAAQVARDYKISPVKTWQFFVENEYPDSINSQEKGCPKSTFLGLCQEGMLKDIPAGYYTNSQHNKRYGLNAVQILLNNPDKKFEPSELWKEVLKLEEDKNKRLNSQMDIVLGLWENGLIESYTVLLKKSIL